MACTLTCSGARFSPRAHDGACWELSADGQAATSVDGTVTLRLKDEPHGAARAGEQGRLCTAADGGEALGQLRLLRGPAELPSVSLAHLRENGWVVLTELIHPDTCADLSAHFDRMQAEAPSKGKRIGLGNIVNATPSVARAAVHPVSLLLLEEYIKSPIHLGHPPSTAIVKPQDPSEETFGINTEFQSTADKGGWHSVRAPAPFPLPLSQV